jgi:RHS repeat-associated protein
MRKNGTLTYIIGDHLGSTSIVTDDEGTVISQQYYKAWGEVRYESATSPTNYTYTGQYSYVSDFGLYFYNARWYDSSLGRFAQADTIIPSGVQGLDRYAYVNNNPIMYRDPSGHCGIGIVDPDDCLRSDRSNAPPPLSQQLAGYGITTNNSTPTQRRATLQAAQLAGGKIAETIGGGISSQDAFRQAQGDITINFNANNTNYCETVTREITCGTGLNMAWGVQTIIHEFGHVFDNQFEDIYGRKASDYPDNEWRLTYEGYKDDWYPSMQHPAKDDGYGNRARIEDFADMYLNWVLDMNPAFPDNGFTNEGLGNDRRNMMNNTAYDPNYDLYPRGMPVWLRLMGLMP